MLYKRYKKKPKNNKKRSKNNLKRDTGSRRKFFLSFISAFSVFALFAAGMLYLYIGDKKYISANTGTSQKISAPEAESRKVDASFTMLIAVKSDVTGAPKEFILYRLDEKNQRTVITALPKKLRVVNNGSGVALSSVYKNEGIGAAAEVISKSFSLKIDHYMDIGSTNFSKIFDKVGGLYTDVPKTFAYKESADAVPINLTRGRNQYVTGDKIYALIANCSDSDRDIKGDLALQEDIMKEFVTNKLTGVYMKDYKTYYGPIFNMVSTRFSMYDLMKKSQTIASLSNEKYVVTPEVNYTCDSQGDKLYKFSDDAVISEYLR